MSNYSVLPWYRHIEGQDFRRWWKYGRIYPLYSRTDRILPSFFYRDGHETGNVYYREDVFPITSEGNLYPNSVLRGWNPVTGTGCAYSVRVDDLYGFAWDYLAIVGAVKSPSGYAWALVDSDDMLILSGDGDTILNLTEHLGETLYLQLSVTESIDEQEELDTIQHPRLDLTSGYEQGSRRVMISELYTPDGKFVKDVWADDLWHINTSGENDLLYPVGRIEIPQGQYYIKASDGVNTWYSDVFTAVADDLLPDFLLLEWWNDEPLTMASGYVLPSLTGMGNKNKLYLRADIAKPEYQYEEEGETRDGHFYPSKQISKKTYRFNFFAVEYLLDVLRLIPLADHITITRGAGLPTEREYNPETILLTPTWEAEGDLAAVAVEFETDTIAKKLGLAYILGE